MGFYHFRFFRVTQLSNLKMIILVDNHSLLSEMFILEENNYHSINNILYNG
jgi:hypothetical protein